MSLELRIDNNQIIKDVIKAINFFSQGKYEDRDLDTLVSDRINSLDLSDINIAHFGTNRIAKQIILEMA